MDTLELVIPYHRGIPQNFDYYFDQLSRQVALTVLFRDQEDWRRTDEVHYIFEGVTAIIGSLGLLAPIPVGNEGIYRVTSNRGAGSKFVFRYSDEDVKMVFGESVKRISSSASHSRI